MHSKFKLYSIFNGIIQLIFLLNILIYFNNGYVKMQLAEKAEKNGEWIWILHLLLLVSQQKMKEMKKSWYSKHDRTWSGKERVEKNLWNEVMRWAFIWQLRVKKDDLWQYQIYVWEEYFWNKVNSLMVRQIEWNVDPQSLPLINTRISIAFQQSLENVHWKYLKI